MTFDPESLQVNDEVGIQPSGRGESPYRFGTVSKVTKTQVTVTDGSSGCATRFLRRTGKEVGAGDWYAAGLVSVTHARESNKVIQPRLIKRRAGAKLAHIMATHSAIQFHQRQLGMAIIALDERHAGDLPPAEPNPTAWGFAEDIGVSVRVLVKLGGDFHGGQELRFGRYFVGLEAWNVEGLGGTNDPDVIEWWPLPDGEI